jgi:hypothetical protein
VHALDDGQAGELKENLEADVLIIENMMHM